MLTLNDGRNELWQWDTNRKLTVDADCSQVHFSNKVFGRSVDVDVIGGIADIPDFLLQSDKDLTAWAFVGTAENGYTKISKTFKVNRRNKPADYVFTPPDQTSLEEIKEKIDYLESIQDPDAIKNAVEDYLEENPPAAYTLPIATETTLGGVKAAAATEEMTQPVGITAEGKLVTVPGQDSGGNADQLEPAEDDIPKVFFGAALPQTKDDTIMTFRYISKTMDFSGYCKTKAQGSSSMNYPKKNQTAKLYRDADCTEELKVNFRGWGPRNKFCFKANWIDLTHARNVVTARLWGDVVKTRQGYAEIPELLRTSPNQGAVDGFPVKVYANGIYQGRYTLNIPKDAWMASMDDELDTHCILCGENYISGCFRAEANIDGSDWTDEIHETVPESIKTRWNEAIRFVMNSTDEEFVAGIGNYFDVESLIDYYLFGLIACNNDGFGKNQLYMTYDGQKWYATVYDLDNTFGTYLGYVLAHDFPRNRYEDYYASYETRYGNLLYIRLESLFTDAIKTRYAELKNGALSLTNIINRFERFTDITPAELVKEDYAETTVDGAFADIPLKEESNIQQIRNYIVKRYPYVDGYIESLGTDPTLLYSLPGETTFDGTSGQQIDTGILLFDEPKSFTILVDVQSTTEMDYQRIFDACDYGTAEDNWAFGGGLGLRTYPYAIGFDVVGEPSNGDASIFAYFATEARTKMAVVFTDGLPTSFICIRDGEIVIRPKNNNYETPVIHNYPLIIGSNNGGGQRFVGTVYSLEVYDKAMTTEEIAEKLS